MSESVLPFHSFTFTLVADKRPRTSFRMKALETGMYQLQVEKGSASNATTLFKREVPLDVAQRFKDTLQDLGVFGWEEAYGDVTAPGSRRWSVNTVFKEGVFSVASKGGSDAPAAFDSLLEELYRLDFPRPDAGRVGVGATASQNAVLMGGLNPATLGGLSPAALRDMLGSGEMSEMLNQLQGNPQLMQQRMKEEFRRMSPDEQDNLLDMLASTGMASREWWEKFLRG